MIARLVAWFNRDADEPDSMWVVPPSGSPTTTSMTPGEVARVLDEFGDHYESAVRSLTEVEVPASRRPM